MRAPASAFSSSQSGRPWSFVGLEAPQAVEGAPRIGAVADPAEREADRLAETMLAGSADGQASPAAPARPSAGRDTAREAIGHIGSAVRSPGNPLDPRTRARFEDRLGLDLGHVRLHRGADAARSAGELDARAYALGSHILLGDRQGAPGTTAGERLLAHEVAHVVQSGAEPGVVRRQPISSAAVTPDPTRRRLSPDETARLQAFLQRHQIVVLRRERRAWFDGQRMGLADAIARVRREAQILLPDDDVIAAYIDSQFMGYVGGAGSAPSGAPAGPGGPSPLLRPNLPMGHGLDQPAHTLQPHLSPADRTRIQDYLSTGGFRVGPGLQPTFGGASTTLEALTDQCRALVLPIIARDEVAGAIGLAWSRLVLDALRAPLPPPPPFTVSLAPDPPGPQDRPQAPPKLQTAVGWQGTWHLSRRGAAEHTIQVQATQGDGPAQIVYQFQYNATTGDIQALAGVQLQSDEVKLVADAIHTVFKASAFLQVVGGITNVGGNSASGALSLQIQGGVQVTATFHQIVVTVQAGPTLTFQQGQGPGLDFNPAVQGGGENLPPGAFPQFHGIPLLRGTF